MKLNEWHDGPLEKSTSGTSRERLFIHFTGHSTVCYTDYQQWNHQASELLALCAGNPLKRSASVFLRQMTRCVESVLVMTSSMGCMVDIIEIKFSNLCSCVLDDKRSQSDLCIARICNEYDIVWSWIWDVWTVSVCAINKQECFELINQLTTEW